MRIEPRGLQVLTAGLLLAAGGWLFGLPEASALAGGAVVLVVLCLLWVWINRPRLTVARAAVPTRCSAGDPCKVHLIVENLSRRRTAVIEMADRVTPFGRANFRLAPIARFESVTAGYSFPTGRRGRFTIGPLAVSVTDPFGLVRFRADAPTTDLTLVIWPRSWLLSPERGSGSPEVSEYTRISAAASTVDEEFSALREYAAGDDVRRIHWPSTARVGVAMVRQVEPPSKRLTTVLVDVRSIGTDAGSLDRSASAAASIVRSSAARHELVRLVTSGADSLRGRGRDSGIVDPSTDMEALMDQLASLTLDQPGPDVEIRGSLGQLLDRASANLVQLVICGPQLGGNDREAVAEVAGHFDSVLLVNTSASATPSAGSPVLGEIAWDGTRPLPQVWAERGVHLGDSVQPGNRTER